MIKKLLSLANRGIWTIIFIVGTIFCITAAVIAFFNEKYLGAVIMLVLAITSFVGIFKKEWKKDAKWLDLWK